MQNAHRASAKIVPERQSILDNDQNDSGADRQRRRQVERFASDNHNRHRSAQAIAGNRSKLAKHSQLCKQANQLDINVYVAFVPIRLLVHFVGFNRGRHRARLGPPPPPTPSNQPQSAQHVPKLQRKE
jgi:hypothetical protein